MGVTFNFLRDQAPQTEGPGFTPDLFYVTERLWLTADRACVVEDGHPDSAYLYAIPGEAIPMGEAAKYGLVKAVKKPVEAAIYGLVKAVQKPKDKAYRRPKDK